MIIGLVLSLFSLLGVWAGDATGEPCPVSDANGFQKVSENLDKIEFLLKHLRATQASVRVNCIFEKHETNDCSATFISDSCYILTAFHCVRGCIAIADAQHPESQLLEPGEVLSGPDRQEPLYYRVDQKKYRDLVFEFKINGKSIPGFKFIASDQGFFDPGLVTGKDSFNAQTLAQLKKINKGSDFGTGTDWAIFKAPPGSCSACSPLAQSPIRVGESISVIGYPRQTDRKGKFDSDGESQYFSSGKVLSDDERHDRFLRHVDCPTCPEKVSPEEREEGILPRKEDNENKIEVAKVKGFFSPETFGSSADSYHGNSGSGALNSNAEVVGVVVEGLEKNQYNARDYLVDLVRTSSILPKLQKLLTPDELKEILTCNAISK